jgi:hypothetical protein
MRSRSPKYLGRGTVRPGRKKITIDARGELDARISARRHHIGALINRTFIMPQMKVGMIHFSV